MGVQLVCNQRVMTYNKFQGINPMGLSAPWTYSLEIIALHPVKEIQGINPMGLGAPWDDTYLNNLKLE